jgi:hypothetical protein
MAERRTLSFSRLDEVMPEVERLLEGHTTVGNWSLGQICNHLATVFRSSVDPPRRAPWIVRRTIGPLIRRRVLKAGAMPTGIKVPDALIPRPGLDARSEAENLRAAMDWYTALPKPPVFEHPFFGRITPEQGTRIHCIHCAHHLSFALPAP